MARYPRCVFCGQRNEPSKEDVLAKWIAREFPDGKLSKFKVQAGWRGKEPDLHYMTRGHMGMITTKPCKLCNNGWMSELETAAKPIFQPLMRGIPRVITTDERLIITRWMVKTAMAYELMRGHSPRYFKPRDYEALMLHGDVPKPLFVHLGQYVGKHATTTSDHDASITVWPNTPQATTQPGYSVTLTIGQLALQLFSFRWPKNYDGPIDIKIPGQWDSATIELWPFTLRNLSWPPEEAFDDAVIDSFADRWLTIRP